MDSTSRTNILHVYTICVCVCSESTDIKVLSIERLKTILNICRFFFHAVRSKIAKAHVRFPEFPGDTVQELLMYVHECVINYRIY